MTATVYHARWILPITSPPIENGRLVVQDGRIVAVEKVGVPDPSAIDLGDAVVLPGFINAHTHLHLTGCRGRVLFRGSFVGWIESLMGLFVMGDLQDSPAGPAFRDGIAQSWRAGVTTVGDIGCGRESIFRWKRSPIHCVGFLETLGMGPREYAPHDRAIEQVAAWCSDSGAERNAWCDPDDVRYLFRLGISPHAPYSTSDAVYRMAIDVGRRTGRPICTHLAETREEEQFLRDGTGPFRDFLERLGLWDGSFTLPRCSPVEYMRGLGLLDLRPLLVHCNYVSDLDLDLVAAAGASIAYCPRSHAFFHHEPHRWREMLSRGINVCVGTDSLASNDTLSVLDELRFLRLQDSTISDGQLLSMGTIAGARALGIADQVGSLEIGKRADFIVLPLSPDGRRDPAETLLRGIARVREVYVAGAGLGS